MSFDLLHAPLNQRKSTRLHDGRDPFERDSARIIHSSAFRRLQNKMQVMYIGESDIYRTRLTHSLEVMQIGRGIVNHLQKTTLHAHHLPSLYLMEAICLAHDLGHPPFGHSGEKALNKVMLEFGGFEGNAQTFRILTTNSQYDDDCGFDLTKRTLLGVVKYPVLYGEVCNLSIKDYPPKCLYDSSLSVLQWILQDFDSQDQQTFTAHALHQNAHAKALHKSLDASIMEKADDIAYAIHDLEDAIRLKIIDGHLWQKHFLVPLEPHLDFINSKCGFEDFRSLSLDRFFKEDNRSSKAIFSKLIHFFITAVGIRKKSTFAHPLLDLEAVFEDGHYDAILDILKRQIYTFVITRVQNEQLAYKGKYIIARLFDAFVQDPKALLPSSIYRAYQEAQGSDADKRVIGDYLSGMTDHYATKVYRRIFDPSYNAIGDVL